MIHLVYMGEVFKEGVWFLLHVDVQLFLYHLLRKLFLTHWIFWHRYKNQWTIFPTSQWEKNINSQFVVLFPFILGNLGWLICSILNVKYPVYISLLRIKDRYYFNTYDRHNNDPQRCPYPNRQNLWTSYFTRQERVKIVGSVKVANQLPSKWENQPGLNKWLNLITCP